MTEREALYRSIIAAPDDDLPRLVFADWLEENGEADYAHFIRKQILLSTLPDYDYRRHIWTAEESTRRLPDAGKELPSLPGCVLGDWQRGFPERIIITDIDAFIPHAAEIFETYPIRSLRVDDHRPEAIARLARVPQLLHIRDFTIGSVLAPDRMRNSPVQIEVLDSLLRLPNLTQVETLRVWSIGWAYLERTGTSDIFLRPQKLILENPDLGNDVSLLLFHSPLMRCVTELTINRNANGPVLLSAMIYSETIKRLRRLRLTSCYISAENLERIADAQPELLEAVHLIQCNLNRDAVYILVNLQLARGLRELSLRDNDFGNEGAMAVAKSTQIRQLESLDLTTTGMRLRGLRSLMNAPWMGSLQSLALNNNPLGTKGAEVLAESPDLGRIAMLSLSNCDFRAEGLIRLLRTPLSGVHALNLSDNRIQGDQELGKVLLDATHLDHLEYIDVGRGAIWDYFREAIIRKYGDRLAM